MKQKKKWTRRLSRAAAICMIFCMIFAAMPMAAAEETVTVCVSMEKFTLGQGYLIEPALIEVPDGEQASQVITGLIGSRWPDEEQPWKMTGTLTDAFYLSAVYDPNRGKPDFPEYIGKRTQLDTGDNSPDWLGEFDYCSTSGWMYSVNNVFPNVGSADYALHQGDVMRWQFTLYGYGSDLGADNSEWGAEDITQVGNKDALTWEVALLNSAYSRTLCTQNSAYRNALSVLQDLETDQGKIDGALKELQANGPRFADVAESAWYRQSVDQAVREGLFKGTSETLFSPDHPLNRAMAATVLYRLAGSPAGASQGFQDVEDTAWYHAAASWAYAKGLMADFSDDQMLPTRNIKRMELASMLYRWLGSGKEENTGALAEFADADSVPEAFRPAMAWVVEQGIFQGDDEHKLSAAAELTRCQFAAITGRIGEMVK